MADPGEPCHLCGETKTMTKEHVPPRSAFNKQRWVAGDPMDALDLPPGETPPGEVRQGGISFPTLCKACNTLTGNLYGNAYKRWAYGGRHWLDQIPEGEFIPDGKNAHVTAKNTNFLRVMKQIVSMFMSVNPIGFRRKEIGEQLARFVLDPAVQGVPDGIRVFMYLNREGESRYLPFMVKGDLTTGDICAVSEITFPPYGYLMTYNCQPPDERLLEITEFANAGDGTATLEASLFLLPTHAFIVPGDYRPLSEVNVAFERSIDSNTADEAPDAI
jgi:hypothetical protein